MPALRSPSSYHGPPPKSAAGLIASDGAFASTLLLLAADAFGDAFTKWHPATLDDEMRRHYGAALPEGSSDRLRAAVLLYTTEYFWESAHRFEIVSRVLNFGPFAPDVVVPPSVAEAAWAVAEAMLVEPPGVPVAGELTAYLDARCRYEGYVTPPKPLLAVGVPDGRDAFARRWADRPDVGGPLIAAAERKTAETDRRVGEELVDLLDQIEALGLRSGDAKAAVAKLRKAA